MNAPAWDEMTALSLTLGGVAGGSAIVAALADHVAGDAHLAGTARYLALASSMASATLTMRSLGRPERFLAMWRVINLASPMSVSVWTWSAFGAVGALGVAEQAHRDGLVPLNASFFTPRALRDWTFALLGAGTAAMPGAVVSATAIPVWYRGRHVIPALLAVSSIAAACAANAGVAGVSGARPATLRKLERFGAVATAAQLALLVAYERTAGDDAAALFGGTNGRALREATHLWGSLVPLIFMLAGKNQAKISAAASHVAPLHRVRAVLSAALGLRGAFALRNALLEAGRASSNAPIS